jgi:hypothetical protein
METPRPEKLMKNLVAYVLIAQTTAIVTLFLMFFDWIKDDRDRGRKIVETSTEIMKNNTEALNQYLNWKRFNEPLQNGNGNDKLKE